MQVKRISVDVNQYQTLMPTDEKLWGTSILDFRGQKKDDWSCLQLFVFNPLKERGNFFYLHPAVLVFDQLAFDALADLLEMAGQILPVKIDGENLSLLNVTECCNALNEEGSEWRADPRTRQRLSIREYRFWPDRFSESSIFKIPQSAGAEVLTFVGLKDENDEFEYRYRQAGLTGLVFDVLFGK